VNKNNLTGLFPLLLLAGARPQLSFLLDSESLVSGPCPKENLGQSSNGFFRNALSLGTSCKTPNICFGIGRTVQGGLLIGRSAQPKREKESSNVTF